MAVETRRVISDPETIRAEIHRKVLAALQAKFPLDAGKFRAELSGLEVEHTPMSHNQQKMVLLGKGNSSDGVYADLKIVEADTGKMVVEVKHHRMLNIPYYTNRYTMMVDGNEYAVINQLRTKSGVYTRKRGNDTLESSFNLSKGANFKLLMAPDTGVFKIEILNSVLPMYCVVKTLGASDADIRQALGEKLYAVNATSSTTQMDRTVDTLYTKLAQYKSGLGDTAARGEKAQKVREYFAGTKMDGEVTKITLGTVHDKVTWQTLLEAAKKILRVYNSEDEYDERDNLEFQTIHSVEDFLAEVLTKSNVEVTKVATKLKTFKPEGTAEENAQRIKEIFSPGYFTRPLRNFITTSSISRLPGQINPMEIMDTAALVTRLGEGAISSEKAVPNETRAVNYSYIGVIDPIATPESSKIGIDNHMAIGAIRGTDNEIYREVRNMKTGKVEKKRLIECYHSITGFPDPIGAPSKASDLVPAVQEGKLVRVRRSSLDYQVLSPHDMSTMTTNTIPFMNANNAVRNNMGQKHAQQALPLKDRDARLVESVIPSIGGGLNSTTGVIGKYLIPKAPVAGVVSKISDDYIHIKDDSGKVHTVDYEHNLPLATKTFMHNDIIVAGGDKVEKGQALAGSNYTRDGKLALGKNLTVAYLPYHGLNHEDGIVISESTANKMTSVHADKVSITMDTTKILNKGKYVSAFGTVFTKAQLAKLDSDGVVMKGSILEFGDPIIVLLEDNANSRSNQVLGRLHKSLVQKYRDASEVYDGHYPAEVLEVHKGGRTVTALLKIEKKAVVGDKMSGSFGNKGVISRIIPDAHMVLDAEGRPVDAILTSTSVISRINPGQILESTLGKIAKKTGKPYQIENFSMPDYTQYVQDEMKKHKVSDKETVTDPITGKKIPDVFVGVQHMYKLFKTTDSNYAARGIEGPHDADESPVGSGETGPKALGNMEVNALLSHNARNLLAESTMIRSAKNMDFWRSFQDGQVAHFPQEKKTFTRFTNILRQAGVKVDRVGNDIVAGPLTDKDILEASSGEILNERRLDAKLNPESGGLFDPAKTGGLQGTKWSHIKLVEPVINPLFVNPVKVLLGLDTKGLESLNGTEGGAHIRNELNKIDVKKEIAKTEALLSDPKLKGAKLDDQVRKLRYLRTLGERGLKPGDAYTLSVIPVTPPSVRPITVGKTGDLMENDSNVLYRDLVMINNSYAKAKKAGLHEDTESNRLALRTKVKELVGTIAPDNPQLANKGTKGAVAFVAGDQPKLGYFQRHVIYNKTNLSGRATIVPDPSLGMDEVGIPEDAAWSMYKPFMIRDLVQAGHSAISAREHVENRSDMATKSLHDQLGKRPVIVNRAPTLWRHSMLAVNPVLREGHNIHVNTLWEKSTNADHDGDAMQMHLPISDEAIEEARGMMPSKLVFSEKKRGNLLMTPTNEPIVALYKVTLNVGKAAGPVKKFANVAEAWKAYYAGTLKATDPVEIA